MKNSFDRFIDMNRVRIRKGRYFPTPLLFVFALIAVVLVLYVFKEIPRPFAVALTLFVSFLIAAAWSASYLLVIDMEEKKIFDGVWVMGIKLGAEMPFTHIEKIFINKIKTKQTFYSALGNQPATLSNAEYQSYVKTDEGRKVALVTHRNRSKIIEKVTYIIDKLGLPSETLVLPTK